MATRTLKQRRLRRTGLILTVLVLGLSVLAYGLFTFAAPKATEPPPGYQLARQVDLASQTFAAEEMLAFTLDDTTTAGIFFDLESVDTSYLELSLQEADGARMSLLQSQELRTDRQGGGLWERELLPGSYQLLLSASQGKGVLAIYWRHP